jgi:2'-5' RNA ligase
MSSDVIRAFIAVDLPPSVLDALGQITGQLQDKLSDTPVRWVDNQKMHLTLKFLGDISTENISMVKKTLLTEGVKRSPLELGIGGIGAFPKMRHPRVIWVGVEAPSDFFDLRRGIEDSVARLGYNYDKYEFTPHLTLGRISRKASARDVRTVGHVLHEFQVGYLGAARIEEVHLYRSDLSSEGAKYTCLFSAPLSCQENQS